MVRIRLTDPLLNGDLYPVLAGCLPTRVKDEGNVLTVEFTDRRSLDDELEAVRRVTTAWRAAGHLDVAAEFEAA